MKKLFSVPMILVLLMLCGCSSEKGNKDTRFLLDTVVTLTADCDDETLNGAFSLCEDYEKKLSRTLDTSDIWKLNQNTDSEKFIAVSDETIKLINRSVYYSKLTNGKFDITICPVSMLWDFNNEIIPSRDEIAEALRSVDYHSLTVRESTVCTGGAKIDLGGIAKGYIADKLCEYFKENEIKNGIINLGGNVSVFGKKRIVGIMKPFSDGEFSARITLKDKTAVTSGIYQRYIKKDGKIYHHILDPKTGYAAETDIASATVIGDSSVDADALATVSILSGKQKATEIIEKTDNYEAVFIDKDGKISFTSGIYRKNDMLFIK